MPTIAKDKVPANSPAPLPIAKPVDKVNGDGVVDEPPAVAEREPSIYTLVGDKLTPLDSQKWLFVRVFSGREAFEPLNLNSPPKPVLGFNQKIFCGVELLAPNICPLVAEVGQVPAKQQKELTPAEVKDVE